MIINILIAFFEIYLLLPLENHLHAATSNAEVPTINWAVKWLETPEENHFHASLINSTNSIEKPRDYGDFFENLYPLIIGTTVEQARQKRVAQHQYTKNLAQRIVAEGLSARAHEDEDELNRHYIWINDPKNPQEPPLEKFNHCVKNLQKSDAKAWNYHFWTNITFDASRVLLASLRNAYGVNIFIHDIDRDIYPKMRGKAVYNRLFEQKYFTNMSDILRFNILYFFGTSENTFNIYSDFHVEDHAEISPMVPHFDYLFYQEGFATGTCFLGARRGSAAYRGVLEYLDDLSNKISPEWRAFGSDILTPRWTSIGMLTMMMDKHTGPDTRILAIPRGSLITPHHSGSWLRGDHGQTSLRSSPISDEIFFGSEDFILSHLPYAVLADHGWHAGYLELAKLLHRYCPDGTYLEPEEIIDYIKAKRANMWRISQDVYINRTPKTGAPIPKIHHRVWLTKIDGDAVEPDPLMLKRFIDSTKVLPDDFRTIL